MKLIGGGIKKKNTIVIYGGRFQPFHKGHHDVYRFLKEKYDNVFIVTTDTKSKDTKRYPFNFSQKVEIMETLGRVEKNDIYPEPVSNPYSDYYILNHIRYLKSISHTLPTDFKKRITNIDLKNALVLFAISDKDMDPKDGTKPRFVFPSNNLVYTKRKNSKGNPMPAKIQKVKSRKHFKNTTFNNIRSNTNTNFNYVLTVPTNMFNILGENINSATQLRNMIIDPPEGFTSINVLESLYDLKVNSSNKELFEFIIKTIKKAYGIKSPKSIVYSAKSSTIASVANTPKRINSRATSTTIDSSSNNSKRINLMSATATKRKNTKNKKNSNTSLRRSSRLRKSNTNSI